ncbi:hypothetical protein C8046_11765 [Serinibacter arcticus]|uniref:Uncharacterized protein n=1 Tax=Serinibacter arcticus TaxID=1655435 RepID=A0A2U1ZW75_9MICO|nr:hypothetical protein C8046_11765 [Serinibacter arcticus]
MIVMSPLAVGDGLTVVGAIHLERPWNPAKELRGKTSLLNAVVVPEAASEADLVGAMGLGR